jgi:hypothetical protein
VSSPHGCPFVRSPLLSTPRSKIVSQQVARLSSSWQDQVLTPSKFDDYDIFASARRRSVPRKSHVKPPRDAQSAQESSTTAGRPSNFSQTQIHPTHRRCRPHINLLWTDLMLRKHSFHAAARQLHLDERTRPRAQQHSRGVLPFRIPGILHTRFNDQCWRHRPFLVYSPSHEPVRVSQKLVHYVRAIEKLHRVLSLVSTSKYHLHIHTNIYM